MKYVFGFFIGVVISILLGFGVLVYAAMVDQFSSEYVWNKWFDSSNNAITCRSV